MSERMRSGLGTERLVPVVGVVGRSGVGKTTLLERLVPALRARGLAIGVFGDPPSLNDVAALVADDEEIEDLRRCRTGDCGFKLAESRINELRAFDWSAPDARTKVEQLVRFRPVAYLQNYQRSGGDALAVYADRRYRTAVADELHAVLRSTPTMYAYTPQVETYLRGYPRATLEGAESFFYWAKEKAISTSDTVDHSVVRMVVSDYRKALHVLEEHGTLVVDDDILVVEGTNKPGELARIAHKLAAGKVNIEYCYSATPAGAKKGLLVMRVSNPGKALKVLNT